MSGVAVFLDLTNTWVTGKRVHAVPGDVEDVAWRLDPVKLAAAIAGDSTPTALNVYSGQMPPRLIDAWQAAGWQMNLVPVAADRREIGTMVKLGCDAVLAAVSAPQGTRFAIVSSRAEAVPVLDTLRSISNRKATVELWSWSRSSSALKADRRELLDTYDVGYRENGPPKRLA